MTIPIWPRSSPLPHPLKILLWILLACALGGAILHKFDIPVQYYLSLSPSSLYNGFVWTLVSYPFSPLETHFFDLIFRVGIDLLFFWLFGSALMERIGTKHFFILFFGSTLFSALFALGAFLFLPSIPLAGLSPILMAFYVSWAILSGESNHPFLKPFWIAAILAGSTLLFDALGHHWAPFFADLAGVLFGYFFCVIAEKATTSWRLLSPLEKNLHFVIERLHKPQKISTGPKIIDFTTGAPVLDDDQFMDAMLARISRYGEEILTPDEKNRMRKISERKTLKK